MSHTCPHCGGAINPAQMLGNVKSPKKEAAAKKRGEQLKQLWENARKLNQDFANRSDTSMRSGVSRPPTPFVSGGLASGVTPVETRLAHDTGSNLDVPPKPTTLEGKKAAALAALAGTKAWAERVGEGTMAIHAEMVRPLHETPRAPFDINLEGEPHRITTMGKKLGLFYLGGGEPVFARYLAEGELEKFWAERIK